MPLILGELSGCSFLDDVDICAYATDVGEFGPGDAGDSMVVL